MSAVIGEIFGLFSRFGAERYGEDLSVQEHMLQCAALAQSRGSPQNVVVAALLHDIGHMLHAAAGGPFDNSRDFAHEALGSAWLSRAFDETVTAPIALHVQAKRYLCAVEETYFDRLSDASRLSLAVQGGVMDENEAAAFAAHPAFEATLLLRRCDDAGKDASIQTRGIEAFHGLLTAALRSPAAVNGANPGG
jgi:phosphonate degradation associated HDIG domain protein